jgi:hypothetical protein
MLATIVGDRESGWTAALGRQGTLLCAGWHPLPLAGHRLSAEKRITPGFDPG